MNDFSQHQEQQTSVKHPPQTAFISIAMIKVAIASLLVSCLANAAQAQLNRIDAPFAATGIVIYLANPERGLVRDELNANENSETARRNHSVAHLSQANS